MTPAEFVVEGFGKDCRRAHEWIRELDANRLAKPAVSPLNPTVATRVRPWMATHRHTFVVALSLLILTLLLVLTSGCTQQRSLVEDLPAPTFNGPVLVAPQQPRIAVKPTPVPVKPLPQITKSTGVVPKSWIPDATARPWKWIVVHHSATPTGSASDFDRMHRDKGWDELGYDFVIGNGTDSGNGQIEVGPRWSKQKWGAHAKTPDNRYNEYGIGICLVGNFDLERPTPQQLQSLARLSAYLIKTYHISPQNVIGHGDTKATDCPGRYMNVAQFRKQVTQMLADASNSGTTIDLDPAITSAINEPQTAAETTAANLATPTTQPSRAN
jgi:N-acetylmuramoyl-L-alanine amidase